ncbi:MAG: carboxymuconolactone decarboxylase family protein [Lautropia sp.]
MPETDRNEITRRLAAVREKRGFLLPHHGLMALLSQEVLDGYDAAYTALALSRKLLDDHDRETVWLAVLIATDEAIATHHIRKYIDAGGTMQEFAAIGRVAAAAIGASGFDFVATHWLAHLPGFDPRAVYRESIERAAAPLPPRLCWLACCAVQAAKGRRTLLRWSIAAALDTGVPERELAEALTIMMFPGSVPNFVDAAAVWLEMIRNGEVAASADFEAWAALDGQGGYDAAVSAGARR